MSGAQTGSRTIARGDAQFGIWAHWTAQSVPEQGDWFARQMYIQEHAQYNYHLKQYGQPSKFGFMEIDNLWKAEKWVPQALMELYRRSGQSSRPSRLLQLHPSCVELGPRRP